MPESLERWQRPGGTQAVPHHRDPYDGLDAAYRWLFEHWPPSSGHEPADESVYERYLNHPRDTPPVDHRVDICLPLGTIATTDPESAVAPR